MRFRPIAARGGKARVAQLCSIVGFSFLATSSFASGATSDDDDAVVVDKLSDKRIACVTGDAAACCELGAKYETHVDLWGRRVKAGEVMRDDGKAAYYFRLACEAGDSEGCERIARMFERGKGVAQSFDNAALYYQKACELGTARACAAEEPPAQKSQSVAAPGAGPALRQ